MLPFHSVSPQRCYLNLPKTAESRSVTSQAGRHRKFPDCTTHTHTHTYTPLETPSQGAGAREMRASAAGTNPLLPPITRWNKGKEKFPPSRNSAPGLVEQGGARIERISAGRSGVGIGR